MVPLAEVWSSTVIVHSTVFGSLLALGEVGLPADEVGGLHLGALHARLDDGALGVELGAVGAVALLDAAGRAVDADADGYGAVVLARAEDGVPQLGGLVERHVELPAELADVGDPRGQHRGVHALDRDLAAGQHPEPVAGHVVAGERGEDVAGLRAPQADGRDLLGAVLEGRPLGEPVGEGLAVGHAVGAAGDDAEVVLAQPHHGEVGEEATLGVEHRGVDDLADGHVALRDDRPAAPRRARPGR